MEQPRHVSEILTGDNYATWSREMENFLSAKNKIGFIKRTIGRPDTTDDRNNNNTVVSWILNSVSEEIGASIVCLNSAHEIWNDLRDRFEERRNGSKEYRLRRELASLKQGDESVGAYYRKMKGIWESLNNFAVHVCTCRNCTCGGLEKMESRSQGEQTMTFLMGLNESYSHIRGQILLAEPLPPIGKVFYLVLQEEHQRATATAALEGSNQSSSVRRYALGPEPGNSNLANLSRKRELLRRGRLLLIQGMLSDEEKKQLINVINSPTTPMHSNVNRSPQMLRQDHEDVEATKSDELEDLWNEMYLALECSKVVEPPTPIEKKEECCHSFILKDDIGIVCQVCGLVQKSIEKIF